MEREELDQIPWSQLAREVDDGIDRRWYVVGVAVGIVIVAVLAFRLLGNSGGQPVPPTAPLVEPAPATSPDALAPTSTIPETVGPIAESALRAETIGDDLEVTLVAEWFVSDLFTVDGSPETTQAVRSRLDPLAAAADLPHDDPVGDPTYVEWARAFAVDISSGTATVSVAYRTLRTVEGTYVRDPVRAVMVTLTRTGDRWLVTSLPTPTEVP